ncbi:MAG: HD domain-containing phosphohydrolase [Lachnospiraceae bacterium]
MMNVLYTALFLVSFILLVILISVFKHRISIYYILLFMSVLVTNFGYMQLVSAQNLGMAVYANQTVYLGASFSPFFLLMCLSDLCKMKLRRMFQVFFLLWGWLIFLFTSTIGRLPWYYKSVAFSREDGISSLVKEYGPAHILYPLYLYVIIIICVVIIVRAILTKKDVSYFTSILLLFGMVMLVTVYTAERAVGIKMPILPVAYVIALFAMLFMLKRISLYAVAEISAESMAENLEYGFVLWDSRGKYLGSDDTAKEWFPELKDLRIEGIIKSEDTEFLKQAGNWIRNQGNDEDVHFMCGKVIVAATHRILRVKKKKIIHCVYLRDDTKQQEYTRLVEKYNENLEHDVNVKTEKIRNMQDDIIISMASIVENRDSNTGGHTARTSDVVRIFVNHLLDKKVYDTLTPETARCIIKAAPLHDFGKIAIADVVLNKPGKFTEEEYNEMKKHSAKGAVIVERILQNSDDEAFKKIAVNIAHYHHEKWNGKGYPEGLSGEAIPFEARIMALADVFDALVSKRVYKESLGYDEAFSIIEESCASHFDPLLCREFLECRQELEELYNSYKD